MSLDFFAQSLKKFIARQSQILSALTGVLLDAPIKCRPRRPILAHLGERELFLLFASLKKLRNHFEGYWQH